MLDECSAFIVAPNAEADSDLKSIALRLGFGEVVSSLAPRTPAQMLTFYILHYRLNEAAMRQSIAQVRRSRDNDTRYAPIVLLTDDCPADRLIGYIRLGFDDVVPLPERREVLESRLRAQVEATQIYYETDDYLGPDRRRMELPQPTIERRSAANPAITYSIERDPVSGISARRRHDIGQSPMPQKSEATRVHTPGAAIIRFPFQEWI
jgi:hypothetical protein